MKQYFFTIFAYALELLTLIFEIPGFILSGIGLFISDFSDSLKHIS